jgi:hypothetical protein
VQRESVNSSITQLDGRGRQPDWQSHHRDREPARLELHLRRWLRDHPQSANDPT